MLEGLTNDWRDRLESVQAEDFYVRLQEEVERRYREGEGAVYPRRQDLFAALQLTSYSDTKVVILGQDPYHGEGQAEGLSFSVQPGVSIPPSLRNIHKELEADVGCPIPNHGSLHAWAKQGVLLLNTVLTVQEGQAGSHQGLGWEMFTDRIISELNKREQPIVFLLWGKHAQQKAASIHAERHLILASPHPSPFAARRGFFGSKPFSRANEALRSWNQEEIDWCIPNLPGNYV
ncbi:uracil-DNA glycosylase [Paenibacillus sp. GCM10023252]|uniref:uracil-DNA glycosylase n=1 Tax=Paenibacillus sp. GCM10023252 TaxID=3252649 RepID=UPI003620710D